MIKRSVGILFLCAHVAHADMSSEVTYKVSMVEQNYTDYIELLDGRDPMEIEDFGSFAPTRMLLEPFIFQIAPVLGGCNCKVEYTAYEVDTPHARSLEQVRHGIEISHPIAGFDRDPRLLDDFNISVPILSPEEFYVGFYTHEDRSDLLSLKDPEEIRQLRYGVSRHWAVDKQVITHYGFDMHPVDGWNSLMLMLVAKRVDIILQPFTSEPDLGFVDTVLDERFLPIPDVKLSFPFGRSYFVSKKFPASDDFLSALNKGITILRENGTLERANIYAGILNPKVNDLEILFADEKPN